MQCNGLFISLPWSLHLSNIKIIPAYWSSCFTQLEVDLVFWLGAWLDLEQSMAVISRFKVFSSPQSNEATSCIALAVVVWLGYLSTEWYPQVRCSICRVLDSTSQIIDILQVNYLMRMYYTSCEFVVYMNLGRQLHIEL